MSEITNEDLQRAKDKKVTKTSYIDEKHKKLFEKYESAHVLRFNLNEIYSKGAWSTTLQKYRDAYKEKIEKRKLKTISEKDKFENEYEKGNLADFINENPEEEEETEDVANELQNKAFGANENKHIPEQSEEELAEMREEMAEFYTLAFDIVLKSSIKMFTSKQFKETKHTDRRLSSLQKVTEKIMIRRGYRPSFLEELTVHASFYGIDLYKGLEDKEPKENKKKAKEIEMYPDKKIDKFQNDSEKRNKKTISRNIKKEETKKQEPKTNTKGMASIINS